ncbi:type VII secretion-associated serine protease mycosin [Streptomyces polychromogenes]|uniref:Type VII secretion-associated serine protease mycosin n=1 Tax=Streptomyces polychromogenes TaxID=67342 RepID=A0ABP3EW79_9ACTN
MRTRKALSALVGALLVGVAATPTHAQTIRAQQWHLDAMKADDVWKISTGQGITVAVIDSGIERIPELEGQVLPGKDFAAGRGQYKGDERADYDKHGTTIAALVAGSGRHPSGDGAFGLAPGAEILPIRVPHEYSTTSPSWTAAIRYAADSDAKIINVSLVTSKDDPDRADAVKYALSRGKLIFASVGNDGETTNSVLYPAATPGVVGVGAVDHDGVAAKLSQHGPQVDISAPGVDLVTACARETGLCTSSGTSDATALASASAALLWSAHPTWTNNQILRVLLNTAGKPVDGAQRNDYIGYGVVRPRIALPSPGDPGPPDVSPLPDLAAAEEATAAATAAAPPPTPVPPPGGNTPPPHAPQAAAPVDKGDGSADPSWTALGLGLAASLLIGGAVTAVRRAPRR